MTDQPLLDALLANPTVIAVGVGRDGRITHWSAGAADLYGWDATYALGRPVRELVPPGHEDD